MIMAEYSKTGYVNYAEQVILQLKKKGKPDRRTGEMKLELTTSKIRNILSMISSIYDDVSLTQGDRIDEDMQSRVMYVKMRIAYEAGRTEAVKKFEQEAKLFEKIDKIGNSKEQLILFCHYMEALVAYHRFYGGLE